MVRRAAAGGSAPGRQPATAHVQIQIAMCKTLLHMRQKFVMDAGGNGWAATALRLADVEGLKARRIIAQGKASLRATPWVNRPQEFQALKGRQNKASNQSPRLQSRQTIWRQAGLEILSQTA